MGKLKKNRKRRGTKLAAAILASGPAEPSEKILKQKSGETAKEKRDRELIEKQAQALEKMSRAKNPSPPADDRSPKRQKREAAANAAAKMQIQNEDEKEETVFLLEETAEDKNKHFDSEASEDEESVSENYSEAEQENNSNKNSSGEPTRQSFSLSSVSSKNTHCRGPSPSSTSTTTQLSSKNELSLVSTKNSSQVLGQTPFEQQTQMIAALQESVTALSNRVIQHQSTTAASASVSTAGPLPTPFDFYSNTVTSAHLLPLPTTVIDATATGKYLHISNFLRSTIHQAATASNNISKPKTENTTMELGIHSLGYFVHAFVNGLLPASIALSNVAPLPASELAEREKDLLRFWSRLSSMLGTFGWQLTLEYCEQIRVYYMQRSPNNFRLSLETPFSIQLFNSMAARHAAGKRDATSHSGKDKAGSSEKKGSEACRRFNDGECRRTECKYSHECSECGAIKKKKGHTGCTKLRSNSASSSAAPGGTSTGSNE